MSPVETFDQILARPDASVAVVGASDRSDKYGAVIYRDLKRKGYTVHAVNPNRDTVDGDPAYPTLADLPAAPDIVNLVVPPSVGVEVATQALDLGYDRIWAQPGAESPELLALLQEADADYLAHACIMVRTRSRRR